MEHNTIRDDENNTLNDISEKVSEGAHITKKISFQDSEEKKLGRLVEYFKYIDIYENSLESCLEETNCNSSP